MSVRCGGQAPLRVDFVNCARAGTSRPAAIRAFAPPASRLRTAASLIAADALAGRACHGFRCRGGARLLGFSAVRHPFPLLLALATSLFLSGCEKASQPSSVSGTIETDEVRLASRYGGRVVGIFAAEGQLLTNGQPVILLAAPELPARRERVAAQLAEAEAGPRREELAAAKQEWEAAQAELRFAEADARRAQELFTNQTASAAERDRAVTRAEAQEKSVAAARSRYDLLLAGTRPETLAQLRAQLAELDTQLRELQLLSPTNCSLENLAVKVGDVLAPNQEAATLLLTDHLWVRVFGPETWLGRARTGDTANVRVDAYPGRAFRGVVEQVARAAEFTPRNVQTVEERVKQVFGVKVRLDTTDGSLRAGMSADVEFPVAGK